MAGHLGRGPCGLRRNETRMLDAADFGRNPHGAEYGEFGRCQVRFGKAKKGSPPKRRGVLTVFGWTPDVLDEWFTEVRPLLGTDGNPAAWPSERGVRIGCQRINSRFITYRKALGLDDGLDYHSFRRSYVTHLIEDGWDPLRPGTGRSRARQHHVHLHLRLLGLPHPHPAPAPGRHRCRRPPGPEREAGMKRKVGYTWRLREAMAQHRIFTATELVPLLRERGIDLSASQVHRLVSGTPERLSLQVLSALCDILSCTPADLVTTTAENAGVRKTATGDLATPPANVAKLRPRPARILPDA
ncbi:helix-turn-helix domain-containing protein [Streptomyces sp. NBC_00076]|uniref:helix-turn-helix domain-containing protein n=1 Tax=Streptomyces sp. NBC_00076 TaxID=2975642 RepID=UPI00386EECC3